jgi:hypothetical protein
MAKDDKFYVDLVGQIMDGFSEFEWGGRPIYIRHHNFREQSEMSRMFDRHKARLEAKGIPTEEKAIEEAIERGDWSKDYEAEVDEAEKKIKALTQAAGKLKIPSQKEAQMELVKAEREQIKEKRAERQSLLNNTVEALAYKRTSDGFMEKILYSDRAMKQRLLEDDDFSDEDIAEITALHSVIYGRFTDENISKAVLCPFFSAFLAFSEDPMGLMGIPVVKMTSFQVKLITIARMFFNIFKNYSVPNAIREDPEAIIEYVEMEQEKRANEAGDSGASYSDPNKKEVIGARTYFGANKEDINKLKEKGEKVVTLKEQLKKHGGHMNLQQMMEMEGD